MYRDGHIPAQPYARHAEVQQVLADGLADADDPVDPRVQEIKPRQRVEIAQVADNPPVGDQLDVHANGCPEAVHGGPLVEHVQYVVGLALELLADDADTGAALLAFKYIRDRRHARLDERVMVERIRPGNDGDIDPAIEHLDKRACLRRIALAGDGKDCNWLAQRNSDLGRVRFFLSNTTIESWK